MEGHITPERLLTVLHAAVNEHGALLWQEQLEREERVRSVLFFVFEYKILVIVL